MDKISVINRVQICRLCLEKLIYIDGDELNSVKIEMLRVLTVDLPFEISNDLVICSTCSEKLQLCFNFKITCLNNDNLIKAFHNCKEEHVLNLEQAFPKQVLTDLPLKIEASKVCRFCLKHFIREKCFNLDQMEKDIFLRDLVCRSVPEMDFSLTLEPVICSECMEALQILFNFIVGCLDVNEIIQSYISSTEYENPKLINLLEVFDFKSNLRMETEYNYNLDHIKVEVEDWNDNNIVGDATIKKELPNDETLPNVDDNKTETDISNTKKNSFFIEFQRMKQNQLYACYHCPYKTAIRASLILHLLVHKNSRDILQLKCDLCKFETKWRTSLRTHMLLHKDKSELKIYKCANCKYQSKYKKHLRRHMETHNSKNFICNDCPFTSKSLKQFKSHCEHHHNIKENKKNDVKMKRGYKCAHCPYETLKSCRIKEHIVKHMDQNETPLFKCDLCHFHTKYKASLSHHKKTHKKKDDAKTILPKLTT